MMVRLTSCNVMMKERERERERDKRKGREVLTLGDGALNQGFVNIQGVSADVHKHRHGAAQHECIGGGGERVRRHNYLVSLPHFAKHSRHFQGCCAGGGDYHLLTVLIS